MAVLCLLFGTLQSFEFPIVLNLKYFSTFIDASANKSLWHYLCIAQCSRSKMLTLHRCEWFIIYCLVCDVEADPVICLLLSSFPLLLGINCDRSSATSLVKYQLHTLIVCVCARKFKNISIELRLVD